jgi:hypothetical protein
MDRTPVNAPQALLDWVLQRGRQLLAIRVFTTGTGYQVSISAPEEKTRVYARYFRQGPRALQVHAALVAGFRNEGWKSVAYR